jgi:hypothetical protein
VFPAQLAIPDGFEGAIGRLEAVNSDCPHFVLHSAKVSAGFFVLLRLQLRYTGKFAVQGQSPNDDNKLFIRCLLSKKKKQCYRGSI